MNPVNFIDPSATISEGCRVWHFARILAGVVLSKDVSVGSGAEIGRGTIVGSRTRISAGVFLPPDSVIGSDVFIGPNVTFTDDRYPRAGNANYHAEPPLVEDGASIGAGSTILPGIRIGRGAIVGAGSVVTKHILPLKTFYGIAATERTTPPEMVVSLHHS